MKLSSNFSSFANEYSFWAYTCSNARYKRVLNFLPDKTVYALDAGCGSGSLAIGMSKKARVVIGVDISKQMLDIAEKKRTSESRVNLQFLQADLQDLPFKRSSFDFIASYGVLHHTNVDRVLASLRELINPQGRIAVNDFTTTDSQQHKVPTWHIRQAIKSVPRYLSKYGVIATVRITRFRLSKRWLAHVCTDELLTTAEFQHTFNQYFPKSVFFPQEGFIAAFWDANDL